MDDYNLYYTQTNTTSIEQSIISDVLHIKMNIYNY